MEEGEVKGSPNKACSSSSPAIWISTPVIARKKRKAASVWSLHHGMSVLCSMPLGQSWNRVTGHRVNDCVRVGSGLGSILLTRFQLCPGRPERRSAILARELQWYNIDVVALSETRISHLVQFEETGSGYFFYCWTARGQTSAGRSVIYN